MLDLKKLFVRESRDAKGHDADLESGFQASERTGDGLESEYQSLVAAQFHRWGIASASITIEVRKLGRAPDGLDVLVGLVRLVKWERESAIRVLLGLPLLETKVRKMVRASWLAEFSHFGGLWLHASEKLHATGGSSELRRLLTQLAPPPAALPGTDAQPLAADYGQSTDPPSTQAQGPAAQDTVICAGAAGASETGEEPVPS